MFDFLVHILEANNNFYNQKSSELNQRQNQVENYNTAEAEI